MTSSNLGVGKSLASASIHQPSNQSGPSTANFDALRRPSQPGPSMSQPTPRRGQGNRRQHKAQRRPGSGYRSDLALDDYDTMAQGRSSRRGQTSITHLLSHSTLRPSLSHGYQTRSYRSPPPWRAQATEKPRYVHANYRFVVSPQETYPSQAKDADLFIDWPNVWQVIASSESQASTCPICLSEPPAPRMAKCGHIFCLPCLIRFMHCEDESRPNKGARWKKCPLCEDPIYLHDVRPVRFFAGQEGALPRVGDDVVLRLMARNANSTLALPWEGGAEALKSSDDVPWHFAANVLDYARIMKGTAEYMADQYDGEVAALLEQEKEDEAFGQDGEWVQKAVNAVFAAKERIVGAAKAQGALAQAKPKSGKQVAEADYYFYSSPPHLYLTPLDIRILKTKYGTFSNFPTTLLPRIEHIATGIVVDDALRKRNKYLGHLPRGCVISLLECDWTDIVPAETLETFSKEIEERRRRNREKAASEDRERTQAERLDTLAMRGSLGLQRPASPLQESPRMDPADFQPLSGATPPDARPGFAPLADMSTSPSTQRTVWGTRAVPSSPGLEPVASSPTRRSTSDDGWLKDDEFLGTAELAVQLEAIDALECNASGAGGPSTAAGGGDGSKKGKRKKKQKITLMSTGGRRGN
ncbi:hypothetical protein CDD82_1980 [Ophiocordyceps australis]|uniref:RING-type domain-containing protein n=1 Tax=Ophiocordyceps australis TaxID=1399860 RepID=A0A2C5ZK31_9HYPO|nr:hypothetical protein CDD82_1980 [Ophiocordyceps australis]